MDFSKERKSNDYILYITHMWKKNLHDSFISLKGEFQSLSP